MTPKLSICVPCYNEEDTAPDSYRRIRAAAETLGPGFEIIFGNDGSTDRTLDLLTRIAESDPGFRVVSHFPNRGQGCTYREMFAAARGELVFILDADLSMAPEDIFPPFLAGIESQGFDVVLGSRFAGVRPDYPLFRRLSSRIYYLINRLLFRIRVRDSQSGFAAFRRQVIEECPITTDGFECLLELFVRIQSKGFKALEVPFPYRYRERTSVRVFAHGLKMLKQTWRIRRAMAAGE